MHVSLSLQEFLNTLKDQKGRCTGQEAAQEERRVVSQSFLLAQEHKDVLGREPDTGNGDKEDHQHEDGTLEVESEGVGMMAGIGLGTEGVQGRGCTERDGPTCHSGEHRGQGGGSQFYFVQQPGVWESAQTEVGE